MFEQPLLFYCVFFWDNLLYLFHFDLLRLVATLFYKGKIRIKYRMKLKLAIE